MNRIYRENSIGIIGSGRVGSNLAYRLRRAGWHIKGIFDVNLESANQIAKAIPTGVYPDPEMIINRCDTVIISTPDSVIMDIIDLIAEYRKTRTKYLMHTSGVLPSRILKAAGAEYSVSSMHPARPVPSLNKNENPFIDSRWSVEGDENSVKLSKKMVNSIGGKVMDIKPGNKALYHAACALLSNHIYSILEAGREMLEIVGLSDERIQATIRELSGNAVKAFTENGMEALTGALKRGDIQTVLEHIAILDGMSAGKYAKLYKETMIGLPNAEKIHQILNKKDDVNYPTSLKSHISKTDL